MGVGLVWPVLESRVTMRARDLLLVALASCHDSTVLVLLNHVGHTGSHAVCETLSSLSCFDGICSEQYEGQDTFWGLSNEVDRSTKPFVVAIVGFYKGWDLGELKRQPLFLEGRVRVLTLVRTDLMRWSLSQYCKYGGSCFESGDPQFGLHELQLSRYRTDVLRRIADSMLVPQWRKQAQQTAAFGDSVGSFVFYEDFLRAGGEEFADWVLSWLVSGRFQVGWSRWCSTNRGACSHDASTEGAPRGSLGCKFVARPAVFVKVHPTDISLFVQNSKAVEVFFAQTPFASWEAIAWGERVAGRVFHWEKSDSSLEPLAARQAPASLACQGAPPKNPLARCGCSEWCDPQYRRHHCLHNDCLSCGACSALDCVSVVAQAEGPSSLNEDPLSPSLCSPSTPPMSPPPSPPLPPPPHPSPPHPSPSPPLPLSSPPLRRPPAPRQPTPSPPPRPRAAPRQPTLSPPRIPASRALTYPDAGKSKADPHTGSGHVDVAQPTALVDESLVSVLFKALGFALVCVALAVGRSLCRAFPVPGSSAHPQEEAQPACATSAVATDSACPRAAAGRRQKSGKPRAEKVAARMPRVRKHRLLVTKAKHVHVRLRGGGGGDDDSDDDDNDDDDDAADNDDGGDDEKSGVSRAAHAEPRRTMNSTHQRGEDRLIDRLHACGVSHSLASALASAAARAVGNAAGGSRVIPSHTTP